MLLEDYEKSKAGGVYTYSNNLPGNYFACDEAFLVELVVGFGHLQNTCFANAVAVLVLFLLLGWLH